MRADEIHSINTEGHLSHIDSWWKKAEGKLSFRINAVWPRWGVCFYACVLLCECVSNATNCPFAVYPMGSGMSLVTACSFSLNGPVAMAAPQSPPPSAQRVTGQLEQGAVTCSLLWLHLRGERSQAVDTINRQGPNKIHLQTNRMRGGPWRSCRLRECDIHIPPIHVAPAIKGSYLWYQRRERCKLHHPEGFGHTSDADRLIVLHYSVLDIFIGCHTPHSRCFAIILSALHLLGESMEMQQKKKFESW